MVDALQNLQVVYARWEERNPHTGKQNGCRSVRSTMWPTVNDTASAPLYRSTRNKGRNRRINGFDRIESLSIDSRNLAWFKSQPIALPVAVQRRPFAARCCSCMPDSRNSLFSDALRSSGLNDILQVETKFGQHDWWTRMFCDISFVMKRKLVHTYPDVSMAVLTSQRLIDAIHAATHEHVESGSTSNSKSVIEAEQRYKQRAKSLLKRMSARISNRLVRFTGWFLHKFLGRLLSAILVHKGQIHMLQKACNSGLPVIFLPTHRSHLDYILITFILFHYDMNAPHVAAGDNLLIPLFGFLMRGLGGFFIRRKLDRVTGQKDFVYRSILHTYMEELLRHGEFLEFFIEGQRTRSGKAVYPKGGLLAVVVDALMNDVIEDVFIVPVSISYDRLLDGNFTKEQMGEPKVYETFWRTIVALYHILMGQYGSVRVDFSQPFSLKEYIKVYRLFPEVDGHRSPCEDVTERAIESSQPVIHRISDSSMDLVSGDARHVIQSLAEHVVHSSVQVLSVTSSQLMALLLLTSHRQGVTMSELCTEFDALKNEILYRDHDVSFAGETIDVITHAMSMLGNRLVKIEPSIDLSLLDDDHLSLVKLIPVTTLPSVFELSYYANVTSTVFAVDSIIANVIYSIIDHEHWLNISHGSLVPFSKNELMLQATQLCTILKYEYIFAPPCRSLDLVLNETLEKLHYSEIVLTSQQLEADDCDDDIEDKMWAKRVASRSDWGFEDSDNEDTWSTPDVTYIVNADAEILKKFWFLKRVLSALLETYYVSACRLTVLLQADMLESVFVSSLHSLLKERVADGTTCYSESAALDVVKNTVYSFRNMRLVDCYEVAGVRMLTLVEPYNDSAVLNTFIRHLESYRE